MVLRFFTKVASEGNKVSMTFPLALIKSSEEARKLAESKSHVIVTIKGVSFISRIREKRMGNKTNYRITIPKRVFKDLGLRVGEQLFVEVEGIEI